MSVFSKSSNTSSLATINFYIGLVDRDLLYTCLLFRKLKLSLAVNHVEVEVDHGIASVDHGGVTVDHGKLWSTMVELRSSRSICRKLVMALFCPENIYIS